MFKLSFALTESADQSEEGSPYLRVEVKALLNERSFFKGHGYLFDAISVLALGVQSGELDVFTCGCGVAGCAGIHEEVRLELTESQVCWHFPVEPFESRFADQIPLAVRFDRVQYAKALSNLEQQLETLRLVRRLPLLVMPCDPVDESDLVRARQPVPVYLEQCRERTRRWLAAMAKSSAEEDSIST